MTRKSDAARIRGGAAVKSCDRLRRGSNPSSPLRIVPGKLWNASQGFSKAEVAAYEAASDDDRRWFAAHPERKYRLRLITPAERVVMKAPGGVTHVVVAQIAPGFRTRQAAIVLGSLPDADAVIERMLNDGIVRIGPGGHA